MSVIRKNKAAIALLVVFSLVFGGPTHAKAEESAAYFLEIYEKVLSNGETFRLQVPSGISYEYTIEGNYYAVSVERDEYSNALIVTGVSGGEATVVVSIYDQDFNYIASDSCRITVTEKELIEDSVVCAVGNTTQLHMSGYIQTQVGTWTSSNPSVATVNETALVTGVSMGYTDVTVSYVESSGMIATYTCQVAVSDPKIQEVSGNLAVDCTKELALTGLQPESSVKITSSNESVAEVWEYSNAIYAVKKGTATITCMIDGVKLTYKVTVTDPQVKVQLVLLVKGTKSKIKVTGTNKKSKISYISSSTSIAKVDKSGYVTGKKAGCSSIQISVDGKVMFVPVSVSNSKVIGALEYGMKAIGTPYSQEKRMEKGYYDCSSLIWRAYHSAGVDIGNKYWAPTAADMAKTLVNNKKAIAYKALPVEKLQPGDLLFFAKTDGSSNGRYKNIYHVAIYCGTYGDEYGSGLLLEARTSQVGMYTYWTTDRNVVVVARPTN